MKNKYKRNWIICEIVSWLLRCVPALVFLGIGFAQGSTTEKLVVSLVTVLAIFILLITIVGKLKLWRFLFAMVLITLCWIGNDIALMITIVGGCNIIDELLMSILTKYYSTKAVQRSQAIEIALANKEANNE